MFLTVFNSTQERIAIQGAASNGTLGSQPIMGSMQEQMMSAIVEEQRTEFVQEEVEHLLKEWQKQMSIGMVHRDTEHFKAKREELIADVQTALAGSGRSNHAPDRDSLYVRRMQEAL